MLQRTAAYMNAHQMAEKNEKIVLGLSGGMDSVCLFHILRDLGYPVAAVHVHHGIRGEEADRDEAFVKDLCERSGVLYYGFHFDVPKISREQHLSVEEAGRMVRKQALAEVMEKTGAKKIALAHHGNDRAETFLFHLSRGTGIRGLGSMKPVQGAVIRPLLWAKREEIAQYMAQMGYRFMEDSTNALTQYTRNKLRHEILPLFEQINPKSVAHICSAAEKLSAAADYLDRQAETLYTLCAERYPKEIRVKKSAFEQGDEVLKNPVLQKCLEYFHESLENITEEHLKNLRQLFKLQTGRELFLPGNLKAVRTYEGIRIYQKEEKRVLSPVKIEGSGTYQFGGNTFAVSVELWDQEQTFPIKTYTKCFDYDKIKDKLSLRTRESGDYLEINRTHGRKILQDYLVNEKVPKEERDQIPLLADGHHILWVIGKRISEYYKVTNETKRILKVQVYGGKIHE